MMDRRVMTNGKAGLDSDVIVVEPGDTQEDQDVGI
jgi:hypothetical protein